MLKKKTNYLYLAFLLELAFIFYLRNKLGFIASPILILVIGLFLAVYPYFLLKENPHYFLLEDDNPTDIKKESRKMIWGIFGGLSLIYIITSYIIFNKYPVDIRQSDIIPFVNNVLLKRFLSGDEVYAPVEGFVSYAKVFTPNYLPLHWLPFLLTSFLHIDHRWTVVFIFIVAAAFYVNQNIKNARSTNKLLLNVLLPFLVIFSIYIKQGKDAAHTIEMMIMGYYLFLSCSFFVKRNFVKTLGVSFPILSRYSFLFWLPSYFFGVFRKSPKQFFTIGLSLMGIILGVFIIPFVLRNPEMLKTFNSVYVNGAVDEWDGQSWQLPGDRPYQLFQGMGFASWFYIYYEGSLAQKVLALKQTLLLVSILSGLIPILFWKRLNKVLSQNLIALLSLKFCLTIFYAFILVPYVYLFWVPLMVSVVILSRINE